MGSKRKSKEEKPSKDEGKTKRHRTSEEEKHKSRKSDKKEKGKDRKSHERRSHKEKKSRDSDKGKHHRKDQHSKRDFQELSSDDYFLKNNEFSTWLKEERNIFFSDLSSESARGLFSEFVTEWNDQKLESRYYEGIASGPRTAHNWKIKA